MAKTFVSSKAVLEYQNKELGKIIGNGRTFFVNMGIAEIPTSFTLTIEIKDKKFRMIFDNIVAWWGQYAESPGKLCSYDNLNQIHRKFKNFVDSLYYFGKRTKCIFEESFKN